MNLSPGSMARKRNATCSENARAPWICSGPTCTRRTSVDLSRLTRTLTTGWKLRLGARLDAAESEARDADGLAYNTTIRDLYVAYNGPAAARTTQNELAGAANVLLTGQLAPGLTTSLGAGFSRQPPAPPSATAPFPMRSAADMRSEIRPPGPRTNTSSPGACAGSGRRSRSAPTCSPAICRTICTAPASAQPPPPPPPPPGAVVYGYRCHRGRFLGRRTEARLAARGGFVASADRRRASEATDRNAHRRLPEIPPATLTLAAGHAWSGAGLKPWIEFGLHCTASKRNPAPEDMPVFADTSAFALGSLRAGFSWRKIRISCAVENLFDRDYYDYLSPPAGAFPPSGNLRPGARIPGPGRSVLLMVSYRGH